MKSNTTTTPTEVIGDDAPHTEQESIIKEVEVIPYELSEFKDRTAILTENYEYLRVFLGEVVSTYMASKKFQKKQAFEKYDAIMYACQVPNKFLV